MPEIKLQKKPSWHKMKTEDFGVWVIYIAEWWLIKKTSHKHR